MKYVKFFVLGFILLGNVQISRAEETCYSYKNVTIRSFNGAIQQWTGHGWITTAISCTYMQRRWFGDGYCSDYDNMLSSARVECPDARPTAPVATAAKITYTAAESAYIEASKEGDKTKKIAKIKLAINLAASELTAAQATKDTVKIATAKQLLETTRTFLLTNILPDLKIAPVPTAAESAYIEAIKEEDKTEFIAKIKLAVNLATSELKAAQATKDTGKIASAQKLLEVARTYLLINE